MATTHETPASGTPITNYINDSRMFENAKMFERILNSYRDLYVNDVQYQEKKSTVWYVSVLGLQKSPIMNFWMGPNSYEVQFRHPEHLNAEHRRTLKKQNSKWLYARRNSCTQQYIEDAIEFYVKSILQTQAWR